MKTTLRSIALAAVAVALAGCGTVTVNPIAQFLDDSATTTAIKTRLAAESSIGSLTGIGVSTRDGGVRLTGTVATNAERQQVEAIARRIAGDNRVASELQGPESVPASPPPEPAVHPAQPRPPPPGPTH